MVSLIFADVCVSRFPCSKHSGAVPRCRWRMLAQRNAGIIGACIAHNASSRPYRRQAGAGELSGLDSRPPDPVRSPDGGAVSPQFRVALNCHYCSIVSPRRDFVLLYRFGWTWPGMVFAQVAIHREQDRSSHEFDEPA